MNEENLIIHFNSTLEFMKQALDNEGVVVVHWYALINLFFIAMLESPEVLVLSLVSLSTFFTFF